MRSLKELDKAYDTRERALERRAIGNLPPKIKVKMQNPFIANSAYGSKSNHTSRPQLQQQSQLIAAGSS